MMKKPVYKNGLYTDFEDVCHVVYKSKVFILYKDGKYGQLLDPPMRLEPLKRVPPSLSSALQQLSKFLDIKLQPEKI
jgi:hypothetical protein